MKSTRIEWGRVRCRQSSLHRADVDDGWVTSSSSQNHDFFCWCSQERRPERQLRMSYWRELFDVTRRSIRMCLYTIVTMWMTTNAWYIRKWALSQVICQIVEINWYWKTRWVRPPGIWRFVSSSSSVWLFHWKWHLSDGSRISDNCDGVDYWICESLWTRLKSCGFADDRATVYCVTWVHGHSVDTIDHIATCLFLTRRKIVSLSDFARDEGTWPTEWLELLGQDRSEEVDRCWTTWSFCDWRRLAEDESDSKTWRRTTEQSRFLMKWDW